MPVETARASRPAADRPIDHQPVSLFGLLSRASIVAAVLLGLVNTVLGLAKLPRSIAKAGVRVGDFSAFLNGWHLARSGSSAIYDIAVQRNTIGQRSGVSWSAEEFPLFVNPPHVALLGWPLGNSSLPVAFGLTALVNVAALFVLLTWVWAVTRPLRRVDRALCVGAILSTPALLHSFRLGSFALIVAAGVVAVASSAAHVHGYPGLPRSSWAWVGAVGVVAISIKPQYLVVIAAALFGLRSWSILGRAAILLSVLTAATTAVLGWRVWGNYLHLLSAYSAMSGRHGLDVTTMINWRSVLAGMFGVGPAVDRVATVLWMASAVAIFLAVRRLADQQPSGHRSRFGPAATAVVVCVAAAVAAVMSPHTNVQDILIAAPAAVCLLAYRPTDTQDAYGALHSVWHTVVRVAVTMAPIVAIVNGPLPNARTLTATAFVIAIGGASLLGSVRPANTGTSSSADPTNGRDAEDASPVEVVQRYEARSASISSGVTIGS